MLDILSDEQLVAWDRDIAPFIPAPPTALVKNWGLCQHGKLDCFDVYYGMECSLYGETYFDVFFWMDGMFWWMMRGSPLGGDLLHLPTRRQFDRR